MTADLAGARGTRSARGGSARDGSARGGPTFLDDLRRRADERGGHAALVARRAADGASDVLDYAGLARLVDRYAAALGGLGVRPGDHVAVQLPNRWEVVPLTFACFAVGAVVVPLQPDTPEDGLRHRLAATSARVCVTTPEWDGRPVAPVVAGLRAELPALRHVLVVGGAGGVAPDRALPDGAVDFHSRFGGLDSARTPAPRPNGAEPAPLAPGDPAVVLFTSGTTGAPKGVAHSQDSLRAALLGYAGALGLDDRWVVAVTSPLVHYSGFAQGFLAAALVGGTVLVQDVKDPDALLDQVHEHRATMLYGPPTTAAAIVAAQRARPRDVSSVERFVIGTAAVPRSLVEDVRDVLGARAHSLWGLSEFGPITLTRPDDPWDAPATSHGRVVDGMAVRIDPTGLPGDGSIGRLWTRGASSALGYHGRQDVFDAQLDDDGWFDTGDLAQADGRGGIRIVCRAEDAVVKRGRVVPAVTVEAVLRAHPDVEDAVVVGIGSSGAEEVLLAVVVAAAGRTSTAGALRGHVAAEGLAEEFVPERVEFVDALPRTLTGKVRKAELRALFR
ncbi:MULTISPECIES: AMP-binding protein [Actinosynnema]|uniref:AMP-binding protein n=1 Tax=Actinosynnema TaxID=40566 RepID=UPI0020A5F860|nr:AMP-binding protein [Actinosynnema pretiosum]MCP2092330.1 cyclohexanecarboxylate-CoA ligase [Actinosynnema pretiosum]